MMLAALVGLVLAIVGICVDFFELKSLESVFRFKLFDEWLAEGSDFPVAAVQAFAIISLILTALAAALVVLGKLGVLRFKGLLKLLFAVLVIAVAALVITFAATYTNQYDPNAWANDNGGFIGGFVGNVADWTKTSLAPAAGAYLVMAGGIVTGVSLLLSRLK